MENALSPSFAAPVVAGMRETAVTAAAAQATAAVNARYVMALQRPRQFDEVRSALLKECRRPAFAESARYALPRSQWDAKTKTRREVSIEGFSIRFAEAALRSLRNVLVETAVIYEDEEKRLVRVSTTDLETNVTYPKDVTIKKTVERKSVRKGQVVVAERMGTDGEPVFVVGCTDDELLMKENALVSRAIRTNGLRLVPGDLLDECEAAIEATLANRDKGDPDAARKRLLDAFEGVGVAPAQLREFLGHDTATISADEIKRLRGVYTTLKEGRSTWEEIIAELEDSVAAFGGGPAASVAESPEARKALVDRLASLRLTVAPETYAKALANVGVGDPASAPLGALEQVVASLAAKTATPAAPAEAAAPSESPAAFAARMAAKKGGPQ